MTWFFRNGTEFEQAANREGHPVIVGALEVIAEDRAKVPVQSRCSRCGGAGGADKWARTGWTCHQCGGHGRGPIRAEKLYTAEKLQKLNEAQAKRRERIAEKRRLQAEQDKKERLSKLAETTKKNREQHPRAMAYLKLVAGRGAAAEDCSSDFGFLHAISTDVLQEGREITVRQAEAVEAAVARIAQKKALDNQVAAYEKDPEPAPAGRVVVSGVVLSCQWREQRQGYQTVMALKVLVLDTRGFRVWVTAPRGLAECMEADHGDLDLSSARGMHVEFQVRLSPQEPGFAFGSRPTKFKLIAGRPEPVPAEEALCPN